MKIVWTVFGKNEIFIERSREKQTKNTIALLIEKLFRFILTSRERLKLALNLRLRKHKDFRINSGRFYLKKSALKPPKGVCRTRKMLQKVGIVCWDKCQQSYASSTVKCHTVRMKRQKST